MLPDTDSIVIDDRAQYISRILNNEAPNLKDRVKSKQKETSRDKTAKGVATGTDSKTQPKKTKTVGNTEHNVAELMETILRELDNTFRDANDSLNSAVTLLQMDATLRRKFKR